MKYLKYLHYVLKHKYHVNQKCKQMGLKRLGILHDWSKFRWSEFKPYTEHFYGAGKQGIKEGRDNTGYYKPTDTGDADFDFAFFLHQKRNRHHWQYWVQPKDGGGTIALKMPVKYRQEMICDWLGASKAQGHGGDLASIREWYLKNGDKMNLHGDTRKLVKKALGFPDWDRE